MDLVTIFGLIVALVGIIGGMILEGGHLASIAQLTAAVIVIGGTLGAVLVSTTREDLKTGLRLLRLGFGRDPEAEDPDETLEELVSAAQLARKESILALESRIPKFKSSFMQNVCRFAIDGVDPAVLRETFESQLEIEEENLVAGAKISQK